MGSNDDIPASSYNREPIHADIGFNNNCIVDELDWFDNIGQTSRRLENFFDKTGVQPFIYLKAHDSALTTDAEKTEFAEDWYEDNIDNEGTFLFMYFAEENQDEDVGYMAYVNGKQVTKEEMLSIASDAIASINIENGADSSKTVNLTLK